jgi:16S rRNA processing protein RimM
MKHNVEVPAPDDLIAIGRITRSVGIKGEVRVTLLTDDADRFTNLRRVWGGNSPASVQLLNLRRSRSGRADVVLLFEEIDSRTAADAWRGKYLFVPSSDALKPKRGSYRIDDIVGLQVVSVEGETLGVVKEVMQLPANDVWVVLHDGKEILLPAIKQVVQRVDLEAGRVVINPMEGLFE